MATRQFQLRLIDYTALTCVTKADLNQGFDTLQPESDIGYVISGQSAPDCVTYPVLAGFLWLELDGSNVPTGNLYYYNGTTWVLFGITDGANILDGTITLSKLSLVGANANDLIFVNGTATGFVFNSLLSGIATNTLPVDRLVKGGTSTMLVTDATDEIAWPTITSVVSPIVDAAVTEAFVNGTFTLAQISTTGALANQVIAYQGLGVNYWAYPDTLLRDGLVGLAKLNVTAEAGLNLLRVNAGSTSVETVTATSVVTPLITSTLAARAANSGELAMPTPTISDPNPVSFVHGLASRPTKVWATVYCHTTDAVTGYVAGDEIPISVVRRATQSYSEFSMNWNDTTIYVVGQTGLSALQLPINITRVSATMTQANWRIKIYAEL